MRSVLRGRAHDLHGADEGAVDPCAEHDAVARIETRRGREPLRRGALAARAAQRGRAPCPTRARRGAAARGRPQLLRRRPAVSSTMSPSYDRRRRAVGARCERRIPATHRAAVPDGRAAEVERGRVRIGGAHDVVPVEDELAERPRPSAPPRARASPPRTPRAPDARRRRTPPVRTVPSPGHQPTATSSASIALRKMKSCDGGCAGRPEKRLTARSNDSPPRVDRRRAAAIRRAELRQHLGRAGRGREVRRNLAEVERRVLVVLVERRRPRRLLRREVELHRPGELADRGEHVARDVARPGDSGVSATRRVRPSLCSTTASCVRRSSATTNAPDPSGAGSGSVSQPRAVRRSAEC